MKRYIIIVAAIVLSIGTMLGCSKPSEDNSGKLDKTVASLIEKAVNNIYGQHRMVVRVDVIQYAKSYGNNYVGYAEVTMKNRITENIYKLAVDFNMIYDGEKVFLQLGQVKNL